MSQRSMKELRTSVSAGESLHRLESRISVIPVRSDCVHSPGLQRQALERRREFVIGVQAEGAGESLHRLESKTVGDLL
jgi:hypothetical protein